MVVAAVLSSSVPDAQRPQLLGHERHQTLHALSAPPSSLVPTPATGNSIPSEHTMAARSATPASNPPNAVPGPLEMLVAAVQDAWLQKQPWPIFASVLALRPPRFDQLTLRVDRNLQRYKGNYFIVATAWATVAVTLNFGRFLLAAFLLLILDRLVRRKQRAERTLDLNERAIALVALLGIIWLTAVGEAVIVAAGLSLLTVALHAALHDTPVDADAIEIATV